MIKELMNHLFINPFMSGASGSLVATFLFFYISFLWLKYGIRIKVEKSKMKDENGKRDTTTIIIHNKSPFTIEVEQSISFYGSQDGQGKDHISENNLPKIIPRFGNGSITLPASRLDDETESIIKSIIIRYSTIDMISFHVSKNIFKEYMKCYGKSS